MGARVSLASINLFVHAPPIRKSRNGSRANMASCPRARGFCTAKSSSASPRQGPHPKRIPAHQTRSRRLNKLSATSGCFERIKLSGAHGFSHLLRVKFMFVQHSPGISPTGMGPLCVNIGSYFCQIPKTSWGFRSQNLACTLEDFRPACCHFPVTPFSGKTP